MRATMKNVVNEVLFVTRMEAAYAAAIKRHTQIFSGTAVVVSTIVQIERLAASAMMIGIQCVARV